MASSTAKNHLIEAFEQTEYTVGRDGVVFVEMVDEDLAKWRVGLRFGEGTALQRGLKAYAERVADPKKALVELRLYFPSDFPKTPPEVRVHEPRLKYEGSDIVSFGGKVCTLLMSTDWTEKLSVNDLLTDIRLRLVSCSVEVADPAETIRPYELKPASQDPVSLNEGSFPTVNNFCKNMMIISSSQGNQTFGSACLDASDRISLPGALMPELYTEHVKLPIIFEIKTQEGRIRHMGISDTLGFVDNLPSDVIVVPDWVAAELRVRHESVRVQIRCVELKGAERILLQPRSSSFYPDVAACSSIGNTQAILNKALRDSKLTPLTVNSGIRIVVPHPSGPIPHMLEVLDVHPPGAVRLISSTAADQWEIEFKVEFAPAPDHEDDEDKTVRLDRINARRATFQQEEEKLASKKATQMREQKQMHILTQKLQLEDAMPSIGKRGTVEVKLTFPDGTQMDGIFKEGAPVNHMTAFITINSPWVEAECVTRENIVLSTMFPRKELDPNDAITSKEHHRQRILVGKRDPEIPPEGFEEHSEDAHAQTIIKPRTDRESLVTAWETSNEMHKVRRKLRADENASSEAKKSKQEPAPSNIPQLQEAPAEFIPGLESWKMGQGDASMETPEELPAAASDSAPAMATDAPAADAGQGLTDEQQAKVLMVTDIVGAAADADTISAVLASCNWDTDAAVGSLLDGF